MELSSGSSQFGRAFPIISQSDKSAIIQAALDGGINWFDTTEFYGGGVSEHSLAEGLKSAGKRPGEVIIATNGAKTVSKQAAAYEIHIKALVADTLMYDVGAVLDAELPVVLRPTPSAVGRPLLKTVSLLDAMVRVGMEKYCWQGGVKTPQEYMTLVRQAHMDVSLIECPTPCLVGEGNPPTVLHQHHVAFEQLRSSRKTQRLFTVEEGAGAHCQINNFPLLHQVVFDCLDDVLR